MQNTNGMATNRALFFTPTIAITAMLLAGCTTAGYRKGDAAALTIQSAAAEVQSERQALDLTMTALKTLVNEPDADLKRSFRHFSSSLDRLIACAHDTDKTGKRMAQRDADYLQAWDKQLGAMEFEHIRDLSQDRLNTVSEHLAKLCQRYHENQSVVQPLISYLTDIRRALSNDLTPAGLESAKPVVENADQSAIKVQTALASLNNELMDSGARLASFPRQSAPLAETVRK
jgi:hypothetical protein